MAKHGNEPSGNGSNPGAPIDPQIEPEGKKAKKGKGKKVLLIVVVVLVVIIIAAAAGGSHSGSSSNGSGQDSGAEAQAFDPANYQEVDYKTVAQSPDSYKDQKLLFKGTVIQVVEGAAETDLRVATSVDGFSDVVFVKLDPQILDGQHVIQNEYVAVYGTCIGQYTYTSALGADVSIPGIQADKVEETKSEKQETYEQVAALFSNATFQKVDEGYGNYTYTAEITNTTDLTLENVSVVLSLYDANGTKAQETYASVNSWAPGETAKFEGFSSTDASKVTPSLQAFSSNGNYYSDDSNN